VLHRHDDAADREYLTVILIDISSDCAFVSLLDLQMMLKFAPCGRKRAAINQIFQHAFSNFGRVYQMR
jgi:hypothetical protein